MRVKHTSSYHLQKVYKQATSASCIRPCILLSNSQTKKTEGKGTEDDFILQKMFVLFLILFQRRLQTFLSTKYGTLL